MGKDRLQSDLRLLVRFVQVYCRHRHADEPKKPFSLKGFEVEKLAAETVELCPQCTRLLAHALVKRTHCPMDPKPMCKHCPKHCYQPAYREQMREVMKYSGRRLVLSGRVDYLLHLFF